MVGQNTLGIIIDWKFVYELFCKGCIAQKDAKSSRTWLEEKNAISVEEITQDQITSYSEQWDSIFIYDELKEQHKSLVKEGLVTFLDDFVRETKFPRSNFTDLYLSLFRLWGDLNAGIGVGKEEGQPGLNQGGEE